MKKPPEEKFLLPPEALGLDSIKSSTDFNARLTKNLILCYCSEGILSSFRTFTAKACNAICGITSGVALKLCHYDANLIGSDTPMPDSVFINLKHLYIILPVIGILLDILIFTFYPLSKKRMAEIHTEIAARQQA